MVNGQQNKNNKQIPPSVIIGGVILAICVPYLIPIGLIVFVIYKVVKNQKSPPKGKKTPLSSAQKSEYREQPPRPRPPQTPPHRPQATMENSTRTTPKAVAPKNQSVGYDRNRFVRVTTDYGARHRENVKRLLDAGLMERDEYNMQVARSHNL